MTQADDDYLRAQASLTPQEKHPAVWGALKQVENELGLHFLKGEVADARLLALVHVVPSSELNFVVSMKSIKESSEAIQIIKASRGSRKSKWWRKIEEIWEHDKILAFDLSEVRDFSGEFKKYFQKHRRNMERAIVALHYACLQ